MGRIPVCNPEARQGAPVKNSSRILALIPARGGSKRLPRKNVLDLRGKPLIAWTIEAALHCSAIDEVCVSTDDPEILDVSRKYGAKVPFVRPAGLAADTATSVQVAEHALAYYECVKRIPYDILIFLQPTSPLRTAGDIEGALALYFEKNARNVVSVCETDHSPLWCNTLPPNGSLKGFLRPDLKKVRSQDLPTYYRVNGSIYIIDTGEFRREKEFFLEGDAYAYVMPKERSIDIDNSMDLLIAETLMDSAK